MTDLSSTAYGAVDAYLEEHLIGRDAVLDAALEDSRTAGLPPINVPPTQGKLLYLLTRLQRAVTVLEIGTLAGYSTIWLARALPAHGRIVTLESRAGTPTSRASTWRERASWIGSISGSARRSKRWRPSRLRPVTPSIWSSSTRTSREPRSTSRRHSACLVRHAADRRQRRPQRRAGQPGDDRREGSGYAARRGTAGAHPRWTPR